MDTFCAEVAVDGWLLLASTNVLSVENDCSSRLFVVDVRWMMEGGYEERPLASDVDAMSRDGFLERIGLRKLAKKRVWTCVRDAYDGEDVAEGGWESRAHHSVRLVAGSIYVVKVVELAVVVGSGGVSVQEVGPKPRTKWAVPHLIASLAPCLPKQGKNPAIQSSAAKGSTNALVNRLLFQPLDNLQRPSCLSNSVRYIPNFLDVNRPCRLRERLT